MVNDFLDDNGIGYWGYMDTMARDISWQVKEMSMVIDKMIEAKEMTKTTCRQAFEEIDRALISLRSSDNERARKDAVRSCINAMEAVVKNYGHYNEIKQATMYLKESKVWWKDEIVKEGIRFLI